MISAGLATLHELRTVYSIADLWVFLEIIAIDRHNAYLASKP